MKRRRTRRDTGEAEAFVSWLAQRFEVAGDLGPLQVTYTIDGDPASPEEDLPHLSGYRSSQPVRIGNDAGAQLQLDVYGELIDSVYLFDKRTTSSSTAWCSATTPSWHPTD